MHAHADLITHFYRAFQRRDAAMMAACYHRDLTFQDEVFGPLDYDATVAMWTMLCARGHDLTITFSKIQADAETGSAHWEARYTFSQTDRIVHNRIDATFRFKGGLIIEHRDRFDFTEWARQALGATGWLLGWTPWLHRKVRRNAAASLAAFQERE